MEFKGTKGKWVIDESISHINEYNTKVYGISHSDCKIQGIANVYEYKENALLISKAPEMLDMLNWFTENFTDVYHKGTDIDNKVLEAKQLIKEATELCEKDNN